MNNDKIFEKAKKVAEKYGKKKSKLIYSPGTSLGKDIISDISCYRYNKENLLIEYLTESFGDGSEMETLNLFEKNFLFKKVRYSSVRMEKNTLKEVILHIKGNWEKRLEKITIHSLL